jgi:hypothetical protein
MSQAMNLLRFRAHSALVAAVVGALAWPALAQDKLVRVDWTSAEIRRFLDERATNPPVSVGSEEEAKLSRLRLPVLGFDRPPAVVGTAFAVGERPQLQRNIVMDEQQPVWYQIVDRYGDLTISVEADLRVQHDFPASYKVYGPGQGVGTEPQVSVFDERSEEGMEGAMAEYTVYKFGEVPYRVTIECTRRNKESCRDIATITRDRDQLKLLSARPPQQ